MLKRYQHATFDKLLHNISSIEKNQTAISPFVLLSARGFREARKRKEIADSLIAIPREAALRIEDAEELVHLGATDRLRHRFALAHGLPILALVGRDHVHLPPRRSDSQMTIIVSEYLEDTAR
jgi:hypothetical protein